MKVVTRYDAEIGVLFCTVSGPVDPEVQMATFAQVFDDPGIPDNADAIWDIRHVDFSTASPERIKRLAEGRISVDPQRAGSRFAFVISTDSQEALVRLYLAHVSQVKQESAVFRSTEEAMNWLVGSGGRNVEPTGARGL